MYFTVNYNYRNIILWIKNLKRTKEYEKQERALKTQSFQDSSLSSIT